MKQFKKKYKFCKKYKFFIWRHLILKKKKLKILKYLYPFILFKNTQKKFYIKYKKQRYKRRYLTFKQHQKKKLELIYCYYYNMKPKEIYKYYFKIKKKTKYYNIDTIGFQFLITLESRLENFIFNFNFFKTKIDVKIAIRSGFFLINNKIIYNSFIELKPFQILQINKKYKKIFYIKFFYKIKKKKFFFIYSKFSILNFTHMYFYLFRILKINDIKYHFKFNPETFYNLFYQKKYI